jgi:hypothetical protein
MAAPDPRQFLREALLAVARRARRHVTPKIPSRTLRAALQVSIEETVGVMFARLHLPHYWAIYAHDGRGPISKQRGFLVFFRNPDDDPRLAAGYPERAAAIRHLTREQWRAGLERNRRHIAAGGDPFDAPMIVVRRVGPAQGAFFFTRGMAGFLESEASPEIRERFDRFIQQVIDDGLHEKKTAVLRI